MPLRSAARLVLYGDGASSRAPSRAERIAHLGISLCVGGWDTEALTNAAHRLQNTHGRFRMHGKCVPLRCGCTHRHSPAGGEPYISVRALLHGYCVLALALALRTTNMLRGRHCRLRQCPMHPHVVWALATHHMAGRPQSARPVRRPQSARRAPPSIAASTSVAAWQAGILGGGGGRDQLNPGQERCELLEARRDCRIL